MLMFILGSFFGCFMGVLLMCLLQINPQDNYEEEERPPQSKNSTADKHIIYLKKGGL